MSKAWLDKGSIVDGFKIEELMHRGGMASLWRVTRPGIDVPVLMKSPTMSEGEEASNIVSFEMEQMIMPRLSGPHVPKCFAVGDFAVHPYIVMEQIPGGTLQSRSQDFPLPYDEVADIGARLATALDDLHRQHVVHLDIKPANIMFRPTGEAVLLDFGLSRHDHLPDLMDEEFHLPFGTAPYMPPEQMAGARNESRSDLFATGVILYQMATGTFPFGESETKRGMRRRLWRDPYPPRQLRKDCPPWLQEIVLRCLEVQPAWRYPTAGQLAFDLRNPATVKLTARSEKLQRDGWRTVIRRRFNTDHLEQVSQPAIASQNASAPIVAVAVDVQEGAQELNTAILETVRSVLATMPSARLACLNVLKLGIITIDTTLDEHGHNKHVDRMVALRNWAEPLKLGEGRLTVHVLEATDAAKAILDYAETNRADHIVIGARAGSLKRSILGSVSAKVAAEARCSVTVVRPRSKKTDLGDIDAPETEGIEQTGA